MKQIKNLPLYLSIFVIVIFSVFYFVSVNKYSYAFSYDEVKEASLHQERLIKKCAEVYADSNKNLFDGKETIYITIDDLVQKKLLASENGKIYEAGSSVKEINDKKIRITLSDGKYDIKILND